MPGPQHRQLATRLPDGFVKTVDKGSGPEAYVPHYMVTQYLLWVCGPFGWQITHIHESAPVTYITKKGEERTDRQVEVAGQLTVQIDGQTFTVAGIGLGVDAKKAESDALKRAASKLGVGLHLWAQDSWWLETQWAKDEGAT